MNFSICKYSSRIQLSGNIGEASLFNAHKDIFYSDLILKIQSSLTTCIYAFGLLFIITCDEHLFCEYLNLFLDIILLYKQWTMKH